MPPPMIATRGVRAITRPSFLRVTPDVCRLLYGLVDRPLRQGETGGDVAEHHANAGPDADAADLIGRSQLAVGGSQVADDAQRFVGGGLALLGVEIDKQDQVRRMAAEGRLDRVVHFAVGMYRSLPLDL